MIKPGIYELVCCCVYASCKLTGAKQKNPGITGIKYLLKKLSAFSFPLLIVHCRAHHLGNFSIQANVVNHDLAGFYLQKVQVLVLWFGLAFC